MIVPVLGDIDPIQIGLFLAIPILIILAIAIAVAIAWSKGWFGKYPYTAIVRVARRNGYETLVGKARRGAAGLMDIQFGKEKWSVNAPEDRYIAEGGICEGYSRTNKEIIWTDKIEIKTNGLEISTAIPEGIELAHAHAYGIGYQRTHKMNPLFQYAPIILFLVCCLILFAGSYVYGSMVGGSIKSYGDSMDTLSRHLDDAQIIIYRNATAANQPVKPGAPPG
jgi:hypothetical protein